MKRRCKESKKLFDTDLRSEQREASRWKPSAFEGGSVDESAQSFGHKLVGTTLGCRDRPLEEQPAKRDCTERFRGCTAPHCLFAGSLCLNVCLNAVCLRLHNAYHSMARSLAELRGHSHCQEHNNKLRFCRRGKCTSLHAVACYQNDRKPSTRWISCCGSGRSTNPACAILC